MGSINNEYQLQILRYTQIDERSDYVTEENSFGCTRPELMKLPEEEIVEDSTQTKKEEKQKND